MEEIFRDPLWTFIGTIVAFLTIVVMIAIFLFQRKKKRLSFEVISNSQLLGVKEEIRGKVKVLYDGDEVKNVHLLQIKFTNTGNESISSDDFERLLDIEVSNNSTILTCEIVNEQPENLGAEIEFDDNKISLLPLLLNQKDSFTIKALISDLEGVPKIDGRIRGVKSISKYREGYLTSLLLLLLSVALIINGVIFIDGGATYSIFSYSVTSSMISVASIALSYAIMFFAISKNKRILKIFRIVLRDVVKRY